MAFLDDLNARYLAAHVTKEDAFWAQKMGLRDYREGTYEQAEIDLRDLTSDASMLARVRKELERQDLSPEDRTGLCGWQAFYEANIIEPDEAKRLASDIVRKEGDLERARATMKLGYVDPKTRERVPSDYLQLALLMRTSQDEETRRAAHRGLYEIEDHVLAHGLLPLIEARNRLGRMLGYEDYYDFKVSRNEGFAKAKLFALLDDLERGTREAAKRAIDSIVREKGSSAGQAHNIGFFMSGPLTAKLDPYFGFRASLGRWGRTFQNLGIRYHGALLTLDLLSRPGKYENGFMHAPFPGFVDRGKYRASRVNFTSLGTPGQVGAGYVTLQTLFHEGGHAAHFSNIFMPAPCFSQEFAPTSVAYAETQSMFCDSLVSDVDWRARYAKDARGEAMPRELLEEAVARKQAYLANGIRQLLVVPYVERALYEMSPSELTPENVLRRTREIERELLLLDASPRPTLSIPHLIAGDSSAYYHGYVLAEMAVAQTRAFFLGRDGHLLDNGRIGPDLAEHYWKPGNARPFPALVGSLTGQPFSAAALIREANREVPEALAEASRALSRERDIPRPNGPIDLDARIAVIHGDELIASSHRGESFADVDARFAAWIDSMR